MKLPNEEKNSLLEKFKSNFIKETVSGTSLAISDSSDLAIEDIKLYGDVEQVSTTGAQLYNYEDTKEVTPGITVDDDGWITIEYDNTEGESTAYMDYFSKPLNIETDTDYAIITEVKEVSENTSKKIYLYLSNSYNNTTQFVSINHYFTDLTNDTVCIDIVNSVSDFSSVTTGLRSYVNFPAGTSGSITFRISVLADTTVTADTFTYEPYSNEQASPSPDYPQKIETVTGDVVVKLDNGDSEEQNYTLSLGDIELVGNDTYGRDYLYKSNGKWYKHSLWGKIVLDGVNNKFVYNQSTYNTDTTVFVCLIISDKNTSIKDTQSPILCDKLTQIFNANNGIGIYWQNNTNYIYAAIEATSLSEANEWLVDNPLTVYYAIEETDTEITDTTLLKQLNLLCKAETYRTTTNVSTETDNLQPNLELTYIADTETYIKSLIS